MEEKVNDFSNDDEILNIIEDYAEKVVPKEDNK